ncbi:MAG: TonB-dependent receptor [Vicinamibacteria bacterium]
MQLFWPLSFTLLASPGLGASGSAPPPTPTPTPVFTEVVQVTATRIPESVDDVPASIQVITSDELRDRGATDLKSALALAAGVDVAPGGDNGPASSVPEFWGLKEFDAFLLVVDGVPWGGAFNPALSSLDLSDVERIEVQRGGAPVMYGATSFVGVVHVIRRSPGEKGGRLSLGGGSYGSGIGRVSTHLGTWAGFASSLSAGFERQGFKDDRTSIKVGHVLWRNRKAWGGSVFHFDLDGTFLRQQPSSPTPRIGATLSPLVPIDSNANPLGAALDENRFFLNSGYERTLSRSTWATSLAVSHSGQKQLRGFLTNITNSPRNATGFRANLDLNDLYFDSHLAWAGSSKWKAVAGFDYLFGKADAEGDYFQYTVKLDGSGAPSSVPLGLDKGIGDTRNFFGLYGNLEMTPSPAWNVTLGARLNRTMEERGEAEKETNATGPEPSLKVTRPTGIVGVTYTPWRKDNDRLSLFATYKNTFKPAAIDFNLAEVEIGPEQILKPETANSYEVGLKADLFDRALRLEAEGFLMDFKNLVISQTIASLPSLANAGTSRLQGVELSASLRAQGAWSVRATASLHDAKFRDYLTQFDGVPTQLAGKRLEMSARYLASAALTYSPAQGLFGSADLSFVGERFLNKRNSAPAEAFATVGAVAGYRKGRVEIRAVGRNLSDRRDPVAESELGESQYYRLFPRRIDVSVQLRF